MADGTKAERKKAKEAKERQGTCRLCETQGTLRNSHILPRWAYRNAADSGPGRQPSLVQLADGNAFLSLKQHKEYMLCAACEALFGKREDYVSRIVTKRNGSFPAWRAAKWVGSRWHYDPKALCRRDASAMDCEKVGYFAASVLWRAAVAREFKFTVDLSETNLHELREYLLERASFPPSLRLAVDLIGEGTDFPIDRMFTGPYTHGTMQEGEAEMAFHCFGILGLWFTFLSGDPTLLPDTGPYDLMSDRVMLVNGFRFLFDEAVPEMAAHKPQGDLALWEASDP